MLRNLAFTDLVNTTAVQNLMATPPNAAPFAQKATETVTISAGEVLYIPSNVPHEAHALEDTLDVDVFSPPRQDWLDKTDAYLRKK